MTSDEHTTHELDRLAADLGAVLRAPAGPPQGLHLDDAALTAYIDGVISNTKELERIDEHLADCEECRTVALIAGGESVGTQVETSSSRIRWNRLALAAAALLLVGLSAVLWFSKEVGPRAGLALADYASLGVAERGSVESLLRDGQWPVNDLLTKIPVTNSGAVVRSLSSAVPEPLSPRWSSVETQRPVFAFAAVGGAGQGGAMERVEYEIHVLNIDEQPVAVWVAESSARHGGIEILRSGLPEGRSALERGQDYVWKVNASIEGDVIASTYVPFRVSSSDEQGRLARSLSALSQYPALAATALARAGRIDAASSELLEAAKDLDQLRHAQELGLALYTRIGIGSELAAMWLKSLAAESER